MLEYLEIFKSISLDDLIKMKRNTKREQDKIDIKYLRQLRDEKKEG